MGQSIKCTHCIHRNWLGSCYAILPLLYFLDPGEDYDDSDDAFRTSVENEALDYQKSEENEEDLDPVDAEEILDKYNLRRKKVVNPGGYEPPKNRFWLHDTPGAINESQVR